MIMLAEFLLRAGYDIVRMDARAHGESEGPMTTYGWLEGNNTRAIIDALVATEHPLHIFALGESMGAGIALQSAEVDLRIEAVATEASFASLREASYDYAGSWFVAAAMGHQWSFAPLNLPFHLVLL